MKLTIEGVELTQAIRRGLDFDVPRGANITIITGRGANQDRAEIEWTLEGSPPPAPEQLEQVEETTDEPPFDPDTPVVPEDHVVTVEVTGTDADPFS